MKELKELVAVSNAYGSDKDFVIAGGGNTSFKNDHHIWVKASGTSMATLTEKEFVRLDRKKLRAINNQVFSNDSVEREEQVKSALIDAVVDEGRELRPSVETSLHECIDYAFVVHTHPHKVNALLCARNSKQLVPELFVHKVLYIPYTDPGYTLYNEVYQRLKHYREKNDTEPNIIFIENHGVFVAADTVEEIEMIYAQIIEKIDENLNHQLPESLDLPIDEKARKVLPAIRMLLSDKNTRIVKIRNNPLITHFAESQEHYRKIALPFTPDIIVYCKAKYIYLETKGSANDIINHLRAQLERFVREYGYNPKVILIRELGLIAVENTAQSAETVLDIYEDLMKISYQSASFGGPRFLTPDQISFIDSWEVEHYRRKVAAKESAKEKHLVDQKIVIITGGAQGFGAGIARKMFSNGANIVIADVDEEKAMELRDMLNENHARNQAVYVKTDVADPNDVANAVFSAVCAFGGLDVMISNAGILRAGGVDEMDPATFDLMTDINYKGYFLCVKYSSEIMQVQHEFNPGYYTDIIQINSKSGLKGSNRNFAYAGGKFGGIGLTQSFALELIPFNIKVNAICPGNYLEGPLWSDPDKGLFVQYLTTGKVHGAKNIDDVRKHYEAQVPMNRGCRVDDVLKAIYYVIDQKYETGQAVPVTGGQIMLS